MLEETKAEYLARIRKEQGMTSPHEEQVRDENLEKSPGTFKARLKGLFFLLLSALFLYAILQIFGMLKSN